jgi:hypothetical protein
MSRGPEGDFGTVRALAKFLKSTSPAPPPESSVSSDHSQLRLASDQEQEQEQEQDDYNDELDRYAMQSGSSTPVAAADADTADAPRLPSWARPRRQPQ